MHKAGGGKTDAFQVYSQVSVACGISNQNQDNNLPNIKLNKKEYSLQVMPKRNYNVYSTVT